MPMLSLFNCLACVYTCCIISITPHARNATSGSTAPSLTG